jgi:hypothetical protein
MRHPSSNEVGYKKPPMHSRFRKGTSGNSKGRPKSVTRLDLDLKAELDATISHTINGKREQASRREAMIRSLLTKALDGDPRAVEFFLEHEAKKEAKNHLPSCIIQFYPDESKPPAAANNFSIKNTVKGGSLSRLSRGENDSGAAKAPREVLSPKCPPQLPPIDVTAAPDQVRDNATESNSNSTTGIRMRAPAPYSNHYHTGEDGKAARYSSGADAIIANVRPADVPGLLSQGCVRV